MWNKRGGWGTIYNDLATYSSHTCALFLHVHVHVHVGEVKVFANALCQGGCAGADLEIWRSVGYYIGLKRGVTSNGCFSCSGFVSLFAGSYGLCYTV